MGKKNFRSILTGSFSTPCAGNPTVVMVESGYRDKGLDARFINCDVKPENLKAAVNGARAMEWAGFNCSLPHKVAVIEHLDDLTDEARIIGAVNCVANRDGKLVGTNTDGKGFLASLQDVTDPKGKKVVMFGAGGASRAIAVELGLAGVAHVTVVNRDPSKAESIARLIRENTGADAVAQAWEGSAKVPEGTDIVINATSIGLDDAEALPPIDLETLVEGQVVADVIPNPPMTKLLREAKSRGCKTLDGLGMLVNQGIIGVKFYLDVELNGDVMKKTLKEIFGA